MWLRATILDSTTVMIHFPYFALPITNPHTSLLQTTTKQNSNSLPQAPCPEGAARGYAWVRRPCGSWRRWSSIGGLILNCQHEQQDRVHIWYLFPKVNTTDAKVLVEGAEFKLALTFLCEDQITWTDWNKNFFSIPCLLCELIHPHTLKTFLTKGDPICVFKLWGVTMDGDPSSWVNLLL